MTYKRLFQAFWIFISVASLFGTIYSILYALSLAAQKTFAFLFLSSLVLLILFVIKKCNSFEKRFYRFALFFAYFSFFSIFFGTAFSGAIIILLESFNYNMNDIVTLTLCTLITFTIYFLPTKIDRKILYLKDLKLALFAVNALVLVIFESIVIYKWIDDSVFHAYLLPVFISGLLNIIIIDYDLNKKELSTFESS
ncbi:hypothetical protein ACLMAB_05550 [Brevibacillus laterosporus]